ncbi:MAG: LysM peptidoglycan-binding domain-containing protein [Myxococcales bacterium]|nr:LysM peptidoglycan-binding domain-containing protein [Myxococcales bacterium]
MKPLALAILIAGAALPRLAPAADPFADSDPLARLRALEADWFAERPDTPLALALTPPDRLTTRGLASALAPPPITPLDGFAVPVVLNGPVRDFIDFFQQRGRFIYAGWWARMHRYQPLIRPILEEAGVPPELIYVCMIESGFDPDAVSRAAAVGQWQFVQSTGTEYGLRLDDWVDERRDPIKAARAAARHFKDLHARFGSWPLALAAYNAGVGSISRAMARANTNDYWRLAALGAIPGDATRYVPKVMAAMIIGRDPARYGFGEVRPEAALSFGVVEVPGGLDLESLARSADVPYAALAELNPELRRGFTPPDGDAYPLRVPSEGVERLLAAVDAFEKRRPGVFVEHRVRFGERLRDVALAYGVRQRTLRRLNGLGRAEPEAGQVLVIPKVDKKPPGEPIELLVVTDPALAFDVPGRVPVYFPVRQRTELERIAAFFGVGPGHLALWNGLDPNAPVVRGMVLRIYVPPDFDRGSALLVDARRAVEVAAGTEAADNALAHAQKERSPALKRVSHTVKSGENLWTIARRHGVTVSTLCAENGLDPGDGLSVGQTLKVPKLDAPRPRGKAAGRRAKAGARGRTRYTVRSGDNLSKIARKFDVGLNALRRANGMRGDAKLRPGQKLMIP